MTLNNSFMRFLLVAGCAAAIHASVAGALIWLLPSIPLVAINLVAFTCANVAAYFGHSRFTFRVNGRMVNYLLTTALALGINSSVVVIMDGITDYQMLSIICGMFISSMSMFMLSRSIVFRSQRTSSYEGSSVDMDSLRG